jgi:hypothetical protein
LATRGFAPLNPWLRSHTAPRQFFSGINIRENVKIRIATNERAGSFSCISDSVFKAGTLADFFFMLKLVSVHLELFPANLETVTGKNGMTVEIY